MKPHTRWHHWNRTIRHKGHPDVRAVHTHGNWVTCWKAGLWERLRFLFHGRCWVVCSQKQAPVLGIACVFHGIKTPSLDPSWGLLEKDAKGQRLTCTDQQGAQHRLSGRVMKREKMPVGKHGLQPGQLVNIQLQRLGKAIVGNDGNVYQLQHQKR